MAVPAAAQNNTNIGEFSVNFWMPDPEIVIQSNELSAVSQGTITDLDLVQEFGIEDKSFPEIRFSVGRSHKFRFGYVPIRYDADATLQRQVRVSTPVGPVTLNVGAPASVEYKWDLFRFGYEWDFISMERGFLGVVAELKYDKLEASVDSPLLTSPEGVEQDAPVPTIGVAGRGYVHPMVSIGGEFTGLKISTDEFEATQFDFDINGMVTFGRFVGVQGGYRSVTLDFFIDDDSADMTFKGPYVGAHVKF